MGLFRGSRGWKLGAGGLTAPAATQAQTTPIRHVVVIFQENQSFDSLLGYWCDGHAGRCPDGGMPSSVRLSNGAVVNPATSPDTVPNVNHSVAAQTAAIDGGKMDGWPNIPGGTCNAATGCDSNRVTAWTGPSGRSQLVPSCVPAHLPGLRFGGAFEQTPVKSIPTIMDRIGAAGLTWKLYGANSTQGGYIWSICPTFVECLDTSQHTNLVPDARFLTAAAAGTLPSFSVVTPGGPDTGASCHNQTSITACDNWVGQLVSAIERSPDWSSTAMFITWDDCGCFYDQVPPGTNTDGTAQGPQVPLIIISPYAKPGYTDTTATTFAGILAHAEHTFGLSLLGVNDAAAYPFTHAFNYGQAPLSPARMVHRPLPASAKRLRLTPALENDPT
jgi:phospholipase C